MKLKPGDAVPAFTMTTTDRNVITEKSIKGSITLFLFFPAAFTSTCTKELCGVRDNIAVYNDQHANVIGVSTDSVYALTKYKQEQQLNFMLASDFNKEVSEAFGANYHLFNFGMKGVSKRAAFIADENGIIQYAEVLENSSHLPDFNAIVKKLEELNKRVG